MFVKSHDSERKKCRISIEDYFHENNHGTKNLSKYLEAFFFVLFFFKLL